MTSIGLDERHVRMFPSAMILKRLDVSAIKNPREKALVAQYQQLAKEVAALGEELLRLQAAEGILVRYKIKRNNNRYAAKMKRMKEIEESKALHSLLFHERFILVAQQREIENARAKEIAKLYLEQVQEAVSKNETTDSQ